jgi:protein TonB
MTEGALTQSRRTNPTALAIVLLMHGAGITALALAKGEVIRDSLPIIDIFNVKPDEPPPPEPVKPIEKATTPPPESVVTHVPPVVDVPVPPVFIETKPLPPVELTALPPPPREIVAPRTDPPATPAEAKTVEPARARANLASYVSDEDYPSSAARNEEQGTTRFRLAVGPDGKVKECTVTGSSGSSALDSTTCRLMKQRARFTPAKNNRGEPTGDTVSNAIRWVLPTD